MSHGSYIGVMSRVMSQEDEMEGEVEYFMLLDTFVKKFGQPAKEKIATRLWFINFRSVFKQIGCKDTVAKAGKKINTHCVNHIVI